MAEDLDDGELWLPSDIVPDLGLRRHPKPVSISDPLVDRLAALTLHSPTRFKTPPSPANPLLGFHRVVPQARFASPEPAILPGFVYNGLVLAPSVRLAGSRPVHHFNQMEGFGLRRARVTERQQGNGPDRFFPVRVAGPVRERASGTGVFLPRVTNEAKKKAGMKGGEQQRKPSKNAAAAAAAAAAGAAGGRQGMSFQLPSSEMGLPQDWTY